VRVYRRILLRLSVLAGFHPDIAIAIARMARLGCLDVCNMSQPLSASTLSQLAAKIRRPHYDRAAVKPGLVHIGVGGFFRAHQAVYADDLLEKNGDNNWGYCGVGLLPHDARMRDTLQRQNCLYTVVERDGNGSRARVVGSLVNYLFAPDNPDRVIDTLASADTKIISLTITEGGYHITGKTGGFDADHPDVLFDLANPHRPRGTFGFLAESLQRRMLRHGSPVTLMSCDNIQGNGDLLRRHMITFAEMRDAKLGRWLKDNCTFPNSMVDRITPSTSDEDRAAVRNEYEVDDNWPVMTEPFRQWVMEDHFACGRPAWETCGVQFTQDVAAYEKLKLRILNGSHQALCYIGLLLGHKYVHEAAGDADIRKLVQLLLEREVLPSLTSVPGMELHSYQARVLQRFANAAIRDPLVRISYYGSSGIPQFLIPSIVDRLKSGPVSLLGFVIASWFRCLAGQDDAGRELPSPDPMTPALREIACRARQDPDAVFSGHDLFGPHLSQSKTFRISVTQALRSFYRSGAKETLRRYITATEPIIRP
jgi:mannitol 2-dehydrogenase